MAYILFYISKLLLFVKNVNLSRNHFTLQKQN